MSFFKVKIPEKSFTFPTPRQGRSRGGSRGTGRGNSRGTGQARITWESFQNWLFSYWDAHRGSQHPKKSPKPFFSIH